MMFGKIPDDVLFELSSEELFERNLENDSMPDPRMFGSVRQYEPEVSLDTTDSEEEETDWKFINYSY